MPYEIFRSYCDVYRPVNKQRTLKVVKRGLTLEQAQKHCNDPETSSSTCSEEKKRRITGTWFEGYREY